MLWTLLSKDLRRIGHNPWRYLIFLALPLCITALIGLAFGSSPKGQGLGQIQLAVVDQDDSVLTRMLRGALNQDRVAPYVHASFPTRAEALREINDNRLSAVVIIPRGFTRRYLRAEGPVMLELIKNPAQSIHPAMVEEALGVVITGMNALARNLRSELPAWRELLDRPSDFNAKQLAGLITRLGDKIDRIRPLLRHPLVGYGEATEARPTKGGTAGNIFAFLMPGLAALFLLFIADIATRDLYHEIENHTFERFCTVQRRVLTFLISKTVLAVAVLVVAAVILYAGGAAVFRYRWQSLSELTVLTLAYALFCAGLTAFIAAVARTERRAEVLSNVFIMGLSFAGGSFFPAQNLPPILRDHISPWLPNYAYIEAVRALNGLGGKVGWAPATLSLLVGGLALIGLATVLFRRALSRGLRP